MLTVFGSSNNILLSKGISVIFLSYKPEISAGQVWASGISWIVKPPPCYMQFLFIIGNEGPGKNTSRESLFIKKSKCFIEKDKEVKLQYSIAAEQCMKLNEML